MCDKFSHSIKSYVVEERESDGWSFRITEDRVKCMLSEHFLCKILIILDMNKLQTIIFAFLF